MSLATKTDCRDWHRGEDEAEIIPLGAVPSAPRQDSPRHLLILRFCLINMLGLALLGAAYAQGLVDLVLAADETRIAVLIFVIFVAGLGNCGWRVWQTGRDLDYVQTFDRPSDSLAAGYLARISGRDGESRGMIVAALRLRLLQRAGVVRHVAGSLVLLGLIGTVIGFIIALSGVRPEQVADVNAISPMVSTLISGMSTALYTTLVGSVLNVWLMVNHQLLAGGIVRLMAELIEFGEDHDRA